jgi:GNAT superfamily N-acetyltransferase
MVFADIALARRLEEAESYAGEAFLEALLKLRPSPDFAMVRVAGGRAIFAGHGSPMSEAKALALHEPITDDELDLVESVFLPRNAPVRVVVCPLADPSLVLGLNVRGYRAVEFENVLYRELDSASEPDPIPSHILIRPALQEDAATYFRVVAPNFSGPEGVPPILEDLFAGIFLMTNANPLLVFLDGEPVGGGCLLIHDRVAYLAGAATLPAYRNRGIQTALTNARTSLALSLGCDLLAQGAQPGSTSQRNAERRGLRIAYTKLTMVREAASSTVDPSRVPS